MTTSVPRNWNEGWEKLRVTVDEDVWLLTERVKLQYLLPLIPPYARSLEVGCGSAKLSALLAQRGVRVVGTDRSSQALRVARNNLSWMTVRGDIVRSDAFQLPFADEQFDVVFSTGLLEHFDDPVPLISEMVRTLRPGGVFFSDIVPLKFSMIRAAWYLRGYDKQVQDECSCTCHDVRRWLGECELGDIQVFSSCIAPPLGLVRRIPLVRDLVARSVRLWTIFDGTALADWLGFFYLAFAIKTEAYVKKCIPG